MFLRNTKFSLSTVFESRKLGPTTVYDDVLFFTFDGSTYITIDDHVRMDTSYVSLGGWFYLPATDAGDTAAQNLIGKGTSFQLTVDPHATAANQIRGISYDPADANMDAETGTALITEDSVTLEVAYNQGADVTGTFTPDAWNHIWLTRGPVDMKLYINNVLADTDSTMDGALLANTTDLIIG